MKDFSKDTLMRTSALRPISLRSESSKSIPQTMNLTLSIRRITPISKRPMLQDIKGTQTIESGYIEKLFTKRVIHDRFSNENEESPSLMISNEIVKDYLKKVPRLPLRERPQTGLSARFSLKNKTGKKIELTDKSLKFKKKPVKNELFDNEKSRKPQRMFDYKEIFSIANERLKFK